MALGFALTGLLALAKGRRDLALLLALGTLAFPIEWALKYFTAIPEISLTQLVGAIFNVHGVGLDDIADFPAGHALRATVFYGLVAFCIARLSSDRRQGMTAYAVALALIGSISLVRLYLGAHYPMDLLGGWMAGAALLSILVTVHVLTVDERVRREALVARQTAAATSGRRIAVPLHDRKSERGPPSALLEFIDRNVIPFFLSLYDAVGYVGVAIAIGLETFVPIIPSEVIVPMAGWKVSQSATDPSVLEPLTARAVELARRAGHRHAGRGAG